jgi:hypothetical protein
MRTAHVPALLVMLLLARPPVGAQQWRAGRDIPLIERAIEARLRRDADTVLAGWQASARGMVRFTAEIDHGNGPIERVIRADELQLEVYGEAPNRSKQVIAAWRDTVFQPTAIVYHRDHLGIIANDFGSVIRLGEGEEVRDVPHPLSPAGRDWYEFSEGDTLVAAAPTGGVRVVAVRVRPRDPERAGIVGMMLLDADRAALVRLSFTFTAASYRDATVAGITVRLENALHETQRWLPWRQSIAIRRAAPVVVLPFATVIRADWVIEDYELGLRHPPERFRGMAIDGPRRPQDDSTWTTPWASIPDSLNPQGVEHLEAIDELAARTLGDDFLQGLPSLRLLADGGVSHLLRVNRVQGVTFGGGFRWRAPLGLTLDVRGAVGTADGRVTAAGTVSRHVAGLRMFYRMGRETLDMHEWQRRSGMANSLATLIDGSDAGDWYRNERHQVGFEASPRANLSVTWVLGTEEIEPSSTQFSALDGTRLGNPNLGRTSYRMSQVQVSYRLADGRGWRLSAETGVSGDEARWWRSTAEANGALPLGLEGRIRLGLGSEGLPAHRGFAAGGAGSLPGTVPRSIGGRQLVLVELARPWRVGLPAPIGSRLAGNMLNSRVAPFVAVGVARGPMTGLPWRATASLVPVLGVRMDLWGPLLRTEVGWAPRTGGVSLMIDAHPDWWPLL